jgi:NADH-quinone oxidoreductase subunit A
MSHELSQFVSVGVLLCIAVAFGVVFSRLPGIIGKKAVSNPAKDSPYECGMPADQEQNLGFSVKFYLVAMLFILFDIEVLFIVSWATGFKGLVRPVAEGGVGVAAFWAMVAFIAILEVGHFYVWKQGALTWANLSRASVARVKSMAMSQRKEP